MTDAGTIPHANGAAYSLICFNPTCSNAGTHFPVIAFGTHGRIPGAALPYRLEVPKAVCLRCQKGFQPEVFVTEAVRAKIDDHLERNQRPMADYSRMFVTWKSLAGPEWADVKAAGEARLWF